MIPNSPNPLRLACLAVFAALAWTLPTHAADITLTQAMLDDYHINGTVDFSNATIGYGTNAVTNNLQPGDTIYIEAHTRKFIRINNVTQGTTANPITITNTGGQFIVAGSGPSDSQGLGFGLSGAQHVILKGTPSPGNYDYGIVIASTKTQATGLQISHTGTYDPANGINTFVGPIDIEVSGLEIHDTGFAGIKAKCETGNGPKPPTTFVMDNIRIHDNYIHDTDGEGMYIGWTSAGHEDMSNVLIYDNLVERTGWDGIQLNNAKTGTNAIYGNTILGFGMKSNTTTDPSYTWQASAFSIGASKLDIHHNFIATVSGTGDVYQAGGMSIQFYDHDRIYDNVFALDQYGASEPVDCFWVNQSSLATSSAVLDIVNNTIIRPDRLGLTISDTVTGTVNLVNNIIAQPALNGASSTRTTDYYDVLPGSGVTLNLSHNLFVSTLAGAGFTDAANNDLTLTSSSAAVDAGTSASSYGVTDDIDGISRPQGTAYDIGAYERTATTGGGTIGIITPTGTGTATGSLYCPDSGGFDEQPTWDSTNGVPSGLSASPNNTTATAYANRCFYIDFGPDWANVRITGMWTRWRPYSAGTYAGFSSMWWDDDTDTTNDGTTATGMNFASGTVSGTAAQWTQDADFSSAPVTPQGRYLMVTTDSAPTDRANEFAFSGYTVSGYTTTIITPTATDTATGSSYCPDSGGFNEQPTWDSTNQVPSGLSSSPNDSTGTAYANRYFYIDFGANWAKVRITGMWTRWRPYSAGTYSGFPTMWWDDDTDTTNDGTTATGMNFASGTVTGTTAQWTQDADFSSAPVTPAGRYLIISSGSSPTDRANEFAFSGYVVP